MSACVHAPCTSLAPLLCCPCSGDLVTITNASLGTLATVVVPNAFVVPGPGTIVHVIDRVRSGVDAKNRVLTKSGIAHVSNYIKLAGCMNQP